MGAVRVKLSVDAILVDVEDSRCVDGVVLAVALPDAGPDFVQWAEVLILRKGDASDSEAAHAVFTALLVGQFPCHFFRLCS